MNDRDKLQEVEDSWDGVTMEDFSCTVVRGDGKTITAYFYEEILSFLLMKEVVFVSTSFVKDKPSISVWLIHSDTNQILLSRDDLSSLCEVYLTLGDKGIYEWGKDKLNI